LRASNNNFPIYGLKIVFFFTRAIFLQQFFFLFAATKKLFHLFLQQQESCFTYFSKVRFLRGYG